MNYISVHYTVTGPEIPDGGGGGARSMSYKPLYSGANLFMTIVLYDSGVKPPWFPHLPVSVTAVYATLSDEFDPLNSLLLSKINEPIRFLLQF